MRAEIAVLFAAAGVLLLIGALGYVLTESRIIAAEPPEVPMEETVRPYLPAGMTSLALGLIILVIALVSAVAMRSRR